MAVRHTIVGIGSPRDLEEALRAAYYLADDELSTAAYLALALGKPLLLEGAPGVGKTAAAQATYGHMGLVCVARAAPLCVSARDRGRLLCVDKKNPPFVTRFLKPSFWNFCRTF